MGLSSLVGLVLLLHWHQIHAHEGILHAVRDAKPPSTKDYCITYNDTWTSLPTSISNATYYKLENLSSVGLCSQAEVPQTGIKDKAVVVSADNCGIFTKATFAQFHGAKLLLIAIKGGLPSPSGNRSDYKDVTIPIAYIRYGDVIGMNQDLGNNISVTLYSPTLPLFDYSMMVIFLIAVFTVALGGYWSGLSELEDARSPSSSEDLEGRKKKDDNVTFTPLTVILFVVVCCVMLLLLYFFYKWLVYVIIAVFCLASATSLFNCLSALIQNIQFGKCRVSFCNRSSEVRLLFLAAFCIAMSVTWVVFRNEDSWIWILHDILGISFCLNFIKTLRMPNFKACVILLGLLLLYDVFFVFITPFFTKNGESIMIEVAAGPSGSTETNGENLVEVPAESHATHEKLPIVIRVPRLEFSSSTLCHTSFSLLGFGDIIVPGLLVAYCRRFDVLSSSSSIYYISCTIAYAVGMILTFIVLTVMKMGQPALLYLVPCTLITSSVIAWRRKEMKKFWNGGGYELTLYGPEVYNPLRTSDGAIKDAFVTRARTKMQEIMEHVDNPINEEEITDEEQGAQ